MKRTAHAYRRGITLVELLVVVTIMVLLLAIAIPMMQPTMKSRQVREAARGVNMYFGGARIKAKELGRPVGVLIERSGTVPQGSVILRQIEMPENYGGETWDSKIKVAWDGWLDSNGTVIDRVGFGGATEPPNPYSAVQAAVLRQTRPLLVTIYLDPPNSECAPIFRPGDRIQLGPNGHWAEILPPYRPGTTTPYVNDPTDSVQVNTVVNSEGFVRFSAGATLDAGRPMRALVLIDPSPTATLPWPDDDHGEDDNPPPVDTYATDWDEFVATSMPMFFQIERQPSAYGSTASFGAAAEPLQLPGDSVLDLAASGTDASPTLFGPASTTDNSPVMIIFAPDGAVQSVYHHGIQTRLLEPFYLLIGRRERMLDDEADVTVPTGMLAQKVSADDNLPNWRDPNNLWITVNPNTGTVYAAQNSLFDEAAYGAFDYYNNLTDRQNAFALVRQSARAAQVVGSR